MAETADIDAAVIAALQADAALQALLPDGVFLNEGAPTSAKQFVIVTIEDHRDEPVFASTGWETMRYRVLALSRSGILTNMKAAEARIHAVLEDVPLTVPGYAWMMTAREARQPPLVARDEVDKTLYWFLRGGFYRVQMSRV